MVLESESEVEAVEVTPLVEKSTTDDEEASAEAGCGRSGVVPLRHADIAGGVLPWVGSEPLRSAL